MAPSCQINGTHCTPSQTTAITGTLSVPAAQIGWGLSRWRPFSTSQKMPAFMCNMNMFEWKYCIVLCTVAGTLPHARKVEKRSALTCSRVQVSLEGVVAGHDFAELAIGVGHLDRGDDAAVLEHNQEKLWFEGLSGFLRCRVKFSHASMFPGWYISCGSHQFLCNRELDKSTPAFRSSA